MRKEVFVVVAHGPWWSRSPDQETKTAVDRFENEAREMRSETINNNNNNK